MSDVTLKNEFDIYLSAGFKLDLIDGKDITDIQRDKVRDDINQLIKQSGAKKKGKEFILNPVEVRKELINIAAENGTRIRIRSPLPVKNLVYKYPDKLGFTVVGIHKSTIDEDYTVIEAPELLFTDLFELQVVTHSGMIYRIVKRNDGTFKAMKIQTELARSLQIKSQKIINAKGLEENLSALLEHTGKKLDETYENKTHTVTIKRKEEQYCILVKSKKPTGVTFRLKVNGNDSYVANCFVAKDTSKNIAFNSLVLEEFLMMLHRANPIKAKPKPKGKRSTRPASKPVETLPAVEPPKKRRVIIYAKK